MSMQPLLGIRVLVTRSAYQASSLISLLHQAGAEVVHIPLISIVAPTDPATLREIKEAVHNLHSYHWLIFTSTNGVDFFMHFVNRYQANLSQIHAKVVAVGPKTAQRLQQYGLHSSYPSVYEAEGIYEHLRSEIQKDDRVLIPTSNLARNFLQVELDQLGAKVHRIHVYENQVDFSRKEELLALLQNHQVDYITATSSSTVHNLIKVLAEAGVRDPKQLLQNITLFCIGQKTADTAMKLGIVNLCIAKEATIEGLVDRMIQFTQQK